MNTSNKRRQILDQGGFTLIELLIVILIIGILAAIAIPSFLTQASKGKDACAVEMVHTMDVAMATYATENQKTFDDASPASLNELDSTITDHGCGSMSSVDTGPPGTGVTCSGGDPGTGGGYCIKAVSMSGNVFVLQRASDGSTAHNCTLAGRGTCKQSGNW